MQTLSRPRPAWNGHAGTLLTLASLMLAGCGGGAAFMNFFGNPYGFTGSGTSGSTVGNSGRSVAGDPTSGSSGFTDPCTLPQASKLVRISLRNTDSSDYIHYFLVFIAYVNSSTYPDGGVCPADEGLYLSYGYTLVPAGSSQEFGDYCIVGPALYGLFRGGRFHGGGAGGLASAIAPAQGSTPTYDKFFNSAGAQVPVPDWILFHNPGQTSEGRALKVSRTAVSPCAAVVPQGDPVCQQDAFYYVDEHDLIAGSTTLGTGSGRRVPAEIQGTGCNCNGSSQAYASLAPSGTTSANIQCNQFLRGGRIDFAFVRKDTDPPFPQLVWRVTDAMGTVVHNFDSRAGIQ